MIFHPQRPSNSFKDFEQICQLLNFFKRKGVFVKQTEAQQCAFDTLKRVITTLPMLRMPDFEREFILQTNASGVAVGAQLHQEYKEVTHPVAYASSLLDKHKFNRSTVELECAGIAFGLKQFQGLKLSLLKNLHKEVTHYTLPKFFKTILIHYYCKLNVGRKFSHKVTKRLLFKKLQVLMLGCFV